MADKSLNIATLEATRRMRLDFEVAIANASISRNQEILDALRLETMYEFSEFYFAMDAMGLTGVDDISILADLHNQRIVDLLKNKAAVRGRNLREDRLLDAIFTADIRPRLEKAWRIAPGSLDQSNLARFLVTQMSDEKVRKLVIAATEAGFLTRTISDQKGVIVRSTGVMEQIFNEVLEKMRSQIAALQKDT